MSKQQTSNTNPDYQSRVKKCFEELESLASQGSKSTYEAKIMYSIGNIRSAKDAGLTGNQELEGFSFARSDNDRLMLFVGPAYSDPRDQNKDKLAIYQLYKASCEFNESEKSYFSSGIRYDITRDGFLEDDIKEVEEFIKAEKQKTSTQQTQATKATNPAVAASASSSQQAQQKIGKEPLPPISAKAEKSPDKSTLKSSESESKLNPYQTLPPINSSNRAPAAAAASSTTTKLSKENERDVKLFNALYAYFEKQNAKNDQTNDDDDEQTVLFSNEQLISLDKNNDGTQVISVKENQNCTETYKITLNNEGVVEARIMFDNGNIGIISIDKAIRELKKFNPDMPDAKGLLKSQPQGKSH